MCAAAGAGAGVLLAPWSARLVIAGPDRSRSLRAAWRAASAEARAPGRRLALAAAGAVGGGWGAAGAGWSADLPAFALLGLLGAVLAAIDIRTRRLPNRVVLLLAGGLLVLLAGAAAAGEAADLRDLLRASLCGAAGLAALGALCLATPGGLGLGDAKLFGALAIALGWRGGAPAVFWGAAAGFAIGAAAALALLATGRAGLRTALPFGPPLVLGALLVAAMW